MVGFNALRKANVGDANKGEFYTASFQLSIGFERLMKMILILNHMAANDLSPMSDTQLKKYSHNLKPLLAACVSIAPGHGLKTDQFPKGPEVSYDILCILHEFARASRYYNLNVLSTGAPLTDPLKEWYGVILDIIFDEVSEVKRRTIEASSLAYCDQMGQNNFTYLAGLNGDLMTLFDTVAIPQLISAASPFLAWHTIRIIRPLYDLLEAVVSKVHEVEIAKGITDPTVPYMTEFFPFLLLDKKDFIRRKTLG